MVLKPEGENNINILDICYVKSSFHANYKLKSEILLQEPNAE